MSHETGKIEIAGMDASYFYFRYHRAKDRADRGRFMIYHRDDQASWINDLQPVEPSAALSLSAAARIDVIDGPE